MVDGSAGERSSRAISGVCRRTAGTVGGVADPVWRLRALAAGVAARNSAGRAVELLAGAVARRAGSVGVSDGSKASRSAEFSWCVRDVPVGRRVEEQLEGVKQARGRDSVH